jgi:hypothetical protein
MTHFLLIYNPLFFPMLKVCPESDQLLKRNLHKRELRQHTRYSDSFCFLKKKVQSFILILLSFFFIGVGPVEHCDRFWYWLKAAGIDSNRSGIVQCVAEKLDVTFPGLYDASMYRK